jgi:predicted GIY-YIG superfamily endonuclease
MPLQKICDKIAKYGSDADGASIYALCCNETGEVRYIGKADDPEKRLKSHIRDSRRRNSPVCNWIKKHGKPNMVVLVSGCSDWPSAEREAILFGREIGLRLLNLADGGNQPVTASKKTLSENARSATAKRPKIIMRLFRRLELNIRRVESLTGKPYIKGRNALILFHKTVDYCRERKNFDALECVISKTFVGI